MPISATPVSEARRLGQSLGADRVAVITMNHEGEWCLTTWGATKAQCRALRIWSDTLGESVVTDMNETTI